MGNNRFFDGLLAGTLIGGAAVFLLGTKKGNKILKIISEEGIDGLNKFIDETNENVDDYIEKKEKKMEEAPEDLGFKVHDQENHNHDHKEDLENESTDIPKEELSVKAPKRRFFRKTKKAN